MALHGKVKIVEPGAIATDFTSRSFDFSIDFTQTVVAPTVTIDMAAGNPVSDAGGEPIDVYRNDLVGGKLVIAGGAGSDLCPVKKAEVSVNGGSNWAKADGMNSWSYGLTPREGTYEIVARAYDTNGTLSEEMFQPVEINYFSKTREEVIRELFDTIMRAYQDRDADTINQIASSNYSTRYDSIEDRSRMDNALNGKFTDLSSVYVRYRVSNVIVSGKTSGRVSFTWDANPTATGYSHTGTFSFLKDRTGWKWLAVDDERTFLRYTSMVDAVELAADATRLTANNTDTTTITATVRDSAYDAVKDGTAVQFTASTGTIDTAGVTADGKATVTYTASDVIGPATITAVAGGVSATLNVQLVREFAPPPPGP